MKFLSILLFLALTSCSSVYTDTKYPKIVYKTIYKERLVTQKDVDNGIALSVLSTDCKSAKVQLNYCEERITDFNSEWEKLNAK